MGGVLSIGSQGEQHAWFTYVKMIADSLEKMASGAEDAAIR